MKNRRSDRENLEHQMLSDFGMLAVNSKGRERHEDECDIRTCFQRDVDRIVHSKSFRRLIHKTQVFLQPEGDHYRTRLTHTFEVSRIARTISRALGLNEDLTEAIAYGHDLGHTPFGHAGERAMDILLKDHGGFLHNVQSRRVVDRIERDGMGLNLTYEVRDGILNHTGAGRPSTLEGRVVRLSDRIAYINHDTDDAVRAGILAEGDIPAEISSALGGSFGKRIDTIIKDVVIESALRGEITMGPKVGEAVESFYKFMLERVYNNPTAKAEETKVFGILSGIFGYYANNPIKLPGDYRRLAEEDGLLRAVGDYVSGMTDKYSIYKYGELFIPEAWQVM